MNPLAQCSPPCVCSQISQICRIATKSFVAVISFGVSDRRRATHIPNNRSQRRPSVRHHPDECCHRDDHHDRSHKQATFSVAEPQLLHVVPHRHAASSPDPLVGVPIAARNAAMAYRSDGTDPDGSDVDPCDGDPCRRAVAPPPHRRPGSCPSSAAVAWIPGAFGNSTA